MTLPAVKPADPTLNSAEGPVHAVDGDESSLCGVVAAGGLIQIDHFQMADILLARQCPRCRAVMFSYGTPGM